MSVTGPSDPFEPTGPDPIGPTGTFPPPGPTGPTGPTGPDGPPDPWPNQRPTPSLWDKIVAWFRNLFGDGASDNR